ncbi:MAG: ferritin-like domain-containing protein [Planctomycetota bacterium]|nr:ferritin-like domain-containing protein [Planctomycetota bacterium]
MAHEQHSREIIDALIRAYNAELETVMSYIAASVNLDGVRGKQVAASLAADVPAELGHAQLLAKRIKTIGGMVPGSMHFRAAQAALQPTPDTTDVIHVIKGVIAAEDEAVRLYESIIKLCDGKDYATQDLAIEILGDEQEHRREFVGFLKEYERAG